MPRPVYAILGEDGQTKFVTVQEFSEHSRKMTTNDFNAETEQIMQQMQERRNKEREQNEAE